MIELKGKRMLVTAGSTASPIDKVRVITNIFHGRTGERIALAAALAGWHVTLLSSAKGPNGEFDQDPLLLDRRRYRTFDELAAMMEEEVVGGHKPTGEPYDAIIHSAAVSDYRVASTCVLDDDGRPKRLAVAGSAAAKIPSSHQQLFLELVPTVKLVDKIRGAWGFQGRLVKFKLQADMPDAELLEIAHRSLVQSWADLIVANCLEWSAEYAYVLDAAGQVQKVTRDELPRELLRRLA